jgi:cytochrome c peroxidase
VPALSFVRASALVLLGLAAPAGPEEYTWHLPRHFPRPQVPADNPMSAAKVELGRHLFYDPRLSRTGEVACASCHRQELAFTDGLAVSRGATGEATPRGSMSLANVAYASRLTWANPLVRTLEHQATLPMFGEAPVEMGLSGHEARVLAALRAEPRYPALFAAAWPGDGEIDLQRVIAAIAAFERSLISATSAYDRYVAGDTAALSAAQRRGMALFFSERTECFHCHGGFNFSDAVDHAGLAAPEVAFHNTALYDPYPPDNRGIAEISGDPADRGRFRAPTLRNIAVTAPYMHDGSLPTLDAVIDHYAAGGRAPDNFNKSPFMVGFVLTTDERADLLAFLHSLTDQPFLTDPRHADPW